MKVGNRHLGTLFVICTRLSSSIWNWRKGIYYTYLFGAWAICFQFKFYVENITSIKIEIEMNWWNQAGVDETHKLLEALKLDTLDMSIIFRIYNYGTLSVMKRNSFYSLVVFTPFFDRQFKKRVQEDSLQEW